MFEAYTNRYDRFRVLLILIIPIFFIISNIQIALINELTLESIYDFGDLIGLDSYSLWKSMYVDSTFYSSNYPPLAVLLYKLIYSLVSADNILYASNYINALLIVFTSVSVLFFVNMIVENTHSKLRGEAIAISLLLSDPMLFQIGRANILIVALFFTMIFIISLDKADNRWRIVGDIALGIAFNIKLYPAVFGLVLIKRKLWKDAALSAFSGIVLYFLPALYENLVYGYSIIDNFLRSVHNIIGQTGATWHSISINSIARRTASVFGLESADWLSVVIGVCQITFALITILMFFLSEVREHEYFFLTSLCMFIPNPQYWYVCTFLFIPFMYLYMDKERTFEAAYWFEYSLYILLFIPSYYLETLIGSNNRIFPAILIWLSISIYTLIIRLRQHGNNSFLTGGKTLCH